MIVLGLKCYSHDTGAAILYEDGGELRVTAISEARLNRRKHSFSYPLMAIDYCLDAAGLAGLDEVDLICIDRHMESWPEANSQFGRANAVKRHHPRYDDNHLWNYLIEQSIKFDPEKLRWVNHVDAHAASAYFASPYDEAAVLITEGGTGIYHGVGSELRTIDRIGYLGTTYRNGEALPERRDHFVNSSFFYDAVSALLGYDIFGAGQTMALAGYAEQFDQVDAIAVDPDRYDDFIINHDKTVFGMQRMKPFEGGNDADLVSSHWVNLARQAQVTLEADILYLAWQAKMKTGAKNLCLAGGAALNCIINRKIIESGLFRDVFIQPAASDEGIPLGVALAGYHQAGGSLRWCMDHAYLGRPISAAAIDRSIRDAGLKARKVEPDEAAGLLADGKILGRVAGGSEYGPRSLGNRSILADPRPMQMKDRVNREIKHREGFRPFAPSCLADNLPDFFKGPRHSPFMIVAGEVTPDYRDKVPAVTHADGSCRVQTVGRDVNSGYYDLISAFGERTGMPLLLNTSFNDQNEPIVETPEDAINCFQRTGLDGLLIENRLIQKSPEFSAPDRNEMLAETGKKVQSRYLDLIDRYCDGARYVSLGNGIKAEAGETPDRPA